MSYLIQLKSFVEVYRSGSLSKAASNLGISQPAVTSHIKSLESSLNTELFTRRPHGVIPTDDADCLFRDTSNYLDIIEKNLSLMRVRSKAVKGNVSVIGPAELLWAKSSLLFNVSNPNLTLNILTGDKNKILSSLESGVSDIAITTTKPDSVDLEHQIIGSERLILIVSNSMSEKIKGVPLTKELLFTYPVISYDSHLPLIRDVIRSSFGDLDNIRNPITVPDLRILKSILKFQDGWSVLPDYLCEEDIENGSLVHIGDGIAQEKNIIYVVWSRNSIRKTQVLYFKEKILELSHNGYFEMRQKIK